MTRGRKSYSPERKKSELICVKVTPAQFRVFMALGERFWLRKQLDAAAQNVQVTYQPRFPRELNGKSTV